MKKFITYSHIVAMASLLHADIGTNVQEQLRKTLPLSSGGINVYRESGGIMLEGTVLSLRDKEHIERVIEAWSGDRVDNRIELGDPFLRDAF